MLEKRKEKIINMVKNRQKDLIIVLEDIVDPHNAQAVFRSCEVFGIQDIYIIFDKQKPFNPHSFGKKSSSSANKWLSFSFFSNQETCLQELKKQGYITYATVTSTQATSLYKTSFTNQKSALFFGNEHAGLSNYTIENCDHHILIPQRGIIPCLNLSVSVGIFISEITRQREISSQSYSLTKASQDNLIQHFITKAMKK